MTNWISVKDRLPPANIPVLGFGLTEYKWSKKRPTKIWIVLFDLTYTDERRWRVGCGCSGHDVDEEPKEITHWKPLPEAPND